MNHRSKHPCSFCKTYLKPDGTWASAEVRTLENLLNDHHLWVDSEEDRKFLKEFFNVQFAPLLKGKKSKETLVLEILPIPGLHCIKLGPVNLVWKHLGKRVNLTTFEKKYSLVKGSYHSGEFIGPDCEKIFSKIKELEKHVSEQDPSSVAFVESLKHLKHVNTVAHAETLDPNHREIVRDLEDSFLKLHEDFGVPITPKLHIIFEHLPEFFDLKKTTLLKRTDQTVEATHSKFDKFIKIHNYQIRDVTSDNAGKNMLKAVKHFNSYNLGIDK